MRTPHAAVLRNRNHSLHAERFGGRSVKAPALGRVLREAAASSGAID